MQDSIQDILNRVKLDIPVLSLPTKRGPGRPPKPKNIVKEVGSSGLKSLNSDSPFFVEMTYSAPTRLKKIFELLVTVCTDPVICRFYNNHLHMYGYSSVTNQTVQVEFRGIEMTQYAIQTDSTSTINGDSVSTNSTFYEAAFAGQYLTDVAKKIDKSFSRIHFLVNRADNMTVFKLDYKDYEPLNSQCPAKHAMSYPPLNMSVDKIFTAAEFPIHISVPASFFKKVVSIANDHKASLFLRKQKFQPFVFSSELSGQTFDEQPLLECKHISIRVDCTLDVFDSCVSGNILSPIVAMGLSDNLIIHISETAWIIEVMLEAITIKIITNTSPKNRI